MISVLWEYSLWLAALPTLFATAHLSYFIPEINSPSLPTALDHYALFSLLSPYPSLFLSFSSSFSVVLVYVGSRNDGLLFRQKFPLVCPLQETRGDCFAAILGIHRKFASSNILLLPSLRPFLFARIYVEHLLVVSRYFCSPIVFYFAIGKTPMPGQSNYDNWLAKRFHFFFTLNSFCLRPIASRISFGIFFVQCIGFFFTNKTIVSIDSLLDS